MNENLKKAGCVEERRRDIRAHDECMCRSRKKQAGEKRHNEKKEIINTTNKNNNKKKRKIKQVSEYKSIKF